MVLSGASTQKRFVVLAMPRTGSNMLVSLLDTHPEIDCFGELMRPTPDWMLRKGYRGALRNLEHVDPKYRDDAVRFANPWPFVEELVAKCATKPIVGFKLMLMQHPQFMDELIADAGYAKILLHRANPLAAYSSGEIAKVTGQGTARKGMEVKRAKVTFEEDDFRRYLELRDRRYEDVRRRLAASGPYLEVEYLELVAGDAVPRVVDFLSAKTSVELQPETIKRNSSNLLERFNNPDAVQTLLTALGTEHWAVEGNQPASPASVSR
jgi:LPS sulfotransferase NodH